MSHIRTFIANAKSKNRILSIGTHDGIFHADEVLAVAIIKQSASTFGVDVITTRTRNPDILSSCDLRVDVGGKYDPATGEFDHHHDATLPAACTLVWDDLWNNASFHDYVDRKLLAPISGLDCNFAVFSGKFPIGPYMPVSQAIMDFNDPDGDQQAAFHRAVSVAEAILDNTIRNGRQYAATIRMIENASLIGEFGLELDKAISYNEFREKIGYRHILVYPDPVSGWCVVSLDTNQTNLASAQKLFGAVFAHVAGFFAKFGTREKAVKYAAECSEARSHEIDQWSVCHNDGNGARTSS